MEESSMASNGNVVVYICVSTGRLDSGEYSYAWYSLDPTANHVEKLEHMSALTTYPLHCGCATLGSNIYFFGGCDFSGDKDGMIYGYPWCGIKIFNTVANIWVDEKARPMSAGRNVPIVISLDNNGMVLSEKKKKRKKKKKANNGAIYVFGCITDWGNVCPFAERYDPVRNQWAVLNEPPPEVRKAEYLHSRAVDHLRKRFLLWNHNLFCAYDWVADKWECTSPATLREGWLLYNGSFVAKDNFLYSYFCGDLFAYDLSGKQTLTEPLFEFDQSYPSHRPNHTTFITPGYSPFLVPVGGDDKQNHRLCLIWKKFDRIGGRYSPLPICWATFDIERQDDDKLLAVPKPCGAFNVDHGGKILFCLPMQQPNDDMPKYRGENEKPAVPDALSLLAQLPPVIYERNEHSYSKANKEDFVQKEYEAEDVLLVVKLLRSLKLDKYESIFLDKQIGMAQLEVLEEKDLKGYGLPMGPRKELLFAIRDRTATHTPTPPVKPSTPPVKPLAHTNGVNVTHVLLHQPKHKL